MNRESIRAVKPSTRENIFIRIQKAKELIDTWQTFEATVAQIASKVHLSEYHFSRHFSQLVKQSPHQYIIDRKMEYAIKELEKDDKALQDIALLCGYSCMATFSRSFKQKYHMAPSDFRKCRFQERP